MSRSNLMNLIIEQYKPWKDQFKTLTLHNTSKSYAYTGVIKCLFFVPFKHI